MIELSDDMRADLESTGAESVFLSLPRSGLTLHALDYGGDGPDLVMLPGITTPAVCFDFVASAVRDAFRVVVPDIRGRGLSDRGSSWTIADYAQDTEDLITVLELDDPIVMGHSMGARIAGAVGARGNAPASAVVVIDPPLCGPGRGQYPTTREVFDAQIQEARQGTTAAQVANWWPRWPARECELRAHWLATCDLEAVRATHRSFEEEDFLPIWAAVTWPSVFVYGQDSAVVTPDGLQDCVAALPGARYVAVPDAGHMIFWDNPEVAGLLLAEVLGGLRRS